MKTTFSVPARYHAHVMGVLALLVSETARDAECRADDDVRIQKWAPVSDQHFDAAATGMVTITVEVDPTQPVPTGDFSHYERLGETLEQETVVA